MNEEPTVEVLLQELVDYCTIPSQEYREKYGHGHFSRFGVALSEVFNDLKPVPGKRYVVAMELVDMSPME